MVANKKFTPRSSSNLIVEEEVSNATETPVEVAEVAEDTSEVSTPEIEIEKSEDESNSDGITFTAKTESKPIERMVKIHLARKYDGCIGGVWYHFAKDQVVNVPENVKRILNSDDGMLKPL